MCFFYKLVLHVNRNVRVGKFYRPPDEDPVIFIKIVQKVKER